MYHGKKIVLICLSSVAIILFLDCTKTHHNPYLSNIFEPRYLDTECIQNLRAMTSNGVKSEKVGKLCLNAIGCCGAAGLLLWSHDLHFQYLVTVSSPSHNSFCPSQPSSGHLSVCWKGKGRREEGENRE